MPCDACCVHRRRYEIGGAQDSDVFKEVIEELSE